MRQDLPPTPPPTSPPPFTYPLYHAPRSDNGEIDEKYLAIDRWLVVNAFKERVVSRFAAIRGLPASYRSMLLHSEQGALLDFLVLQRATKVCRAGKGGR